jgi:hypothetical protein
LSKWSPDLATEHQPSYRNIQHSAIGRALKREDINGGHVRLYLEDRRNCLRLILINDARRRNHYVLTEEILRRDFGASYKVLRPEITDAYKKMDNLDHLNDWPAALYPLGTPGQPTSGRQMDGLRELADLTPTSIADAWI